MKLLLIYKPLKSAKHNPQEKRRKTSQIIRSCRHYKLSQRV